MMSQKNTKEIAALVPEFPRIYAQARADWVKFKLGLDRSLFSELEIRQIVEWYQDFPTLWQAIRPNWELRSDAHPQKDAIDKFVRDVDAWSETISRAPELSGLGIAPLIIAGILIAGALGIGGAIWAVGYVKKQNNVSAIIEATVAGQLPPEVLNDAIKADSAGGFLGNIKSILMLTLVGGAVFMLWPQISGLLKKGAR
ncbi:MAG: hypothetical protein ACYTBJ_06775 [Planctomycetota bacterium]